jgi:enamine deaminase RidA (YjgF/YER057c/UK114 family)
MSKRKNISSGTKWEEVAGYSRAVRVGNIVEVAGTTAVDESGALLGAGDPYKQARFILAKIEKALKEAGATLEDVVRTRMFVTDISQWEEFARAHGEAFNQIRPAATMVEIQGLIQPDMLIEIEATAIVTTEK